MVRDGGNSTALITMVSVVSQWSRLCYTAQLHCRDFRREVYRFRSLLTNYLESDKADKETTWAPVLCQRRRGRASALKDA